MVFRLASWIVCLSIVERIAGELRIVSVTVTYAAFTYISIHHLAFDRDITDTEFKWKRRAEKKSLSAVLSLAYE